MKSFNYWSSQEEQFLNYCISAQYSLDEIVDGFRQNREAQCKGFTYKRTPKAIARKRLRLSQHIEPVSIVETDQEIEEDYEQEEQEENEHAHIDEHWEAIRQIQAQYREDSKYHSVGVLSKPIKRKILALSDIHFPLARLDYLDHALTNHSDADIVVLNGDIIDGYMFSTFTKDKRIAAIDEYNSAFEFVVLCSEIFPQVVITEGNHDIRVQKAIGAAGLNHAADIFQPDLLKRFANGERLDREGNLIEKVDLPNVYYPSTERWWVQVGKTIFIHPHSRGSSKPGYTVSSWASKFLERLPRGSFDSIVCGHTHQQSKHIQGSLLLVEQGCLCDYMSYSWKPNQIYHSSAMSGYAVIYQDEDGNTSFNESNFVYLGQLLPSDKPVYSGDSL